MVFTLRNFIVVGLCVLSFGLRAQQSDIVFEQITNQSGRSLGFITGIVQDETGFMWFGTRNGLYRYNGYSYKLFKNVSDDSLSLEHNDITFLYNDKQQNLWIRHYDQLSVFRDEKRVTSFDSITSKHFDLDVKVIQDKQGNYWVGPTKEGLMMYNPNTQETRNFRCPPKSYLPEAWQYFDSLLNTKDIIAEINLPGNNTDTLVPFSITSAGYYLIGSHGEIDQYGRYDYGTLYHNGEKIWELDEKKSMWSGSHIKNRFETNSIYLEVGEYSLAYKSDLSHCCAQWDGDIPDKINFCGIRMVKIEDADHKIIQSNYLKVDIDSNYIASNRVKDLLIDNQGNFWALTDKGLEKYSYKKRKFISQAIDFEALFGVDMKKEYLTIYQDKKGLFWIGSMYGLLQHDYLWGRNLLFQNTHEKTFLTSNTIISIFEDYKGRIWIGTDKGLNIYDRERNTIEKVVADNKNRLYDNRITQIFEDDAKNIWVATFEGLNRMIKNGFTYTPLGFEADNEFPAYYDNAANIWYGIKNKVYKYSRTLTVKDEYALPNYLFDKDEFSGESNYHISDMVIDPDHNIWVATDNRLSRLNILTRDVDYSKATSAIIVGKDSLKNRLNLIAIGKSNTVYSFSANGIHSLNYRDLNREFFYPFKHNVDFIDEIDLNYVKSILKDKKGGIWVRTSDGIYLFKPQLDKLELVFAFDNNVKGGPLSDGTMDIDKYGNVWFAALPHLHKINAETHKVEMFDCKFDHDWGMSNVSIGKENFWIYGSNGVYSYSEVDSAFNFISIDDGLVDNNINGIFEDGLGYVWFTSLKGLVKFDVTENRSLNFFTSSDFTTHRFLGNPKGFNIPTNEEVLFTTHGFLSFFPDSINRHIPKVVIDRFTIRGKDYPLDSLIYYKKNIELTYDQNILGFEFSVLDYTAPSLNRFRYRLEGLEEEWNIGDSDMRRATYPGLAPGKYVFRVQGANNDKIWNTTGASIRIFISPPWYKTIFAYIAYVLLTIFSVWFFIKQRERKLIEEKNILETKVRERTAEIEAQKEELASQNEKIAEQNKNITDSIQYAQRIQAAILPPVSQIKDDVDDFFVLYRPRDIVSGDYYWATKRDNLSIIVAADCTGHGVPGAFMSMLGVAFLNEIVNKEGIIEPDEILNRLREQVVLQLHQTGGEGDSKDGMDVSLYVIDHENMKLKFAGAYNPLYIIRDNELNQLKADRMPIGYYLKMDNKFSVQQWDLQKGDCLYNSSDGYPDQFGGPSERKFMTKNFKQLLLNIHQKPMKEQHDILNRTIDEWRGQIEQIDDIIVIGVRI